MANYGLEYKGNVIFRNQPNHSYFDKPFEDGKDCLYLLLNEIHPYFMQPQQHTEKLSVINDAVRDPRIKKPITQLCYDYTQERQTEIFNSSQQSLMNKTQHKLGIRVIKSLQECLNVDEEDLCSWRMLENVIIKEQQDFQKFVYDFNQNSKEQIYAPCKKLLLLYQKWYKNKCKTLMLKYPQESYNTHLGLPNVRQCRNVLKNQQVQILNQEIVVKVGEQCFWGDSIERELKKLNYSIAAFAEEYINSEDLNNNLENDLQSLFVNDLKNKQAEGPLFYIPLESLLFLLTAGDYVDIPTEMLLTIKENDCSDGNSRKYVLMDVPLPSRQVGWHSYQEVVEQAAVALLSINQTKPQEQEISAYLQDVSNYKVCPFLDYIRNSTLTPNKLCKFSKSLIKWQLNTLDNNTGLQIYTSLTQSSTNKQDPSQSSKSIGSLSFKVEYKPRFGCEIRTKYEILKEWFKLILQKTSTSTCLRLNITNFDTLLQETLTAEKLEHTLSTIYKIDCKQLLNDFFEFLQMIYNMPPDNYMLRYNPKFKDKLMLCKPSREITQNTINLHQLLQIDATDTLFMSQQNFLPIDGNLCNLMHLQHNVLPCAFNPQSSGKRFYKKYDFVKPAVIPKSQTKQYKKPRINKKNLKRKRKRQSLLAAKKAEENEQKELNHEMEIERKMLTF